MQCPACDHALTEKTVGDLTVDVCHGCGGIWFDLFEIKKVDEQHETIGEDLLDIEKDPNVVVDHTRRRNCPKCQGVVMMRHFNSVKREIEVDECPKCGGYWLDASELAQIRAQYISEEKKTQAAQALFKDISADAFAPMHAESREAAEKAKRMAKMFRFICPSTYIPGKQDWGAF